jgi:GTPase SAR1 family protein
MPHPTRDLKIVLLGPVGAGKSTLFHAFVHGIGRRASELGFSIAWPVHPLVNLPLDQAPPPGVTLEAEIRGRLNGLGTPYGLLVTDPPGGQLVNVPVPLKPDPTKPDESPADTGSSPIVQRSSDCDLLVLVVDPPTLTDPKQRQLVQQHMLDHVDNLVKNRRHLGRPDPMVAVVFTKADEYGMSGRVRMRMFDTTRQRDALADWRGAYLNADGTAPARWAALVDAACPERDDPFAATRRQMLEEAHGLIEGLVCNAGVNPDYFNAYLVVSRPADPHVAPYPYDRRGINEVFEDFFDVILKEHVEPPIPLPIARGVAVVAFCLLLLALGYSAWDPNKWGRGAMLAAMGALGMLGFLATQLWPSFRKRA